MSDNMVRRVAWAIAQAKDPQWFGTEKGRTETCLPLARAAIRALREPTEAVIEKIQCAIFLDDLYEERKAAEWAWQAAIDAILTSGGEEK